MLDAHGQAIWRLDGCFGKDGSDAHYVGFARKQSTASSAATSPCGVLRVAATQECYIDA